MASLLESSFVKKALTEKIPLDGRALDNDSYSSRAPLYRFQLAISSEEDPSFFSKAQFGKVSARMLSSASNPLWLAARMQLTSSPPS